MNIKPHKIMIKLSTFSFLVVCLLGASSVQAQKTRLGGQFGLMTTNMNADIDQYAGVSGAIKDGEMDYGYLAGMFLRHRVSIFTIGAEVNFHYFFGNYIVDYPYFQPGNSTPQIIEDLEARYRFINIHVPILVGLKLGPLRASVGPTINKTLDVSQSIENFDNDLDVTDDYKSFYLGYQGGVGVDLGRLSIDLKYDATSNILGGSDASANDVLATGSRTRSSFMLTFGFNFIPKDDSSSK
jgi:hypothetical protein